MLAVRLGRRFDTVFLHDAVDYMVDEEDLRRVIETAFVHCLPGGIADFIPDCTRETFQTVTEHGGSDDVFLLRAGRCDVATEDRHRGTSLSGNDQPFESEWDEPLRKS
jgi:hypothetical protein